MKKSKLKLTLFISILLISFLVFIIIYFKPYSYEKRYQIDEYNILEKYDKNNQYYQFIIEFNNQKIPFIINNKYTNKRKIINNIKLFKDNNELCILPVSDYFIFYPLCTNNKEVYTYNLSNLTDINYKYINVNKTNKEYNDINFYYLNNNSFLLFDYKGFLLINDKLEDNISLFSKDVYKLDLVYQKDNYLIIPDYNNNYYFNRFYIVDILNGKVKDIKNDYEIYFDGFFLGNYKNDIYYVDKKEKKEYKINIQKDSIDEVEYVNIKNNKLVNCNYEDLKEKEIINSYNYIIEQNRLYLSVDNIKIKITDKDVDKIIKIVDDTVYYLSKDTLYMYNNIYGEVSLINNFEWNFNNTNMIFFYK